MLRLPAPLLVAAAVLTLSTAAQATVFSVAPTRIVLTASTASSLVSLKNESPEPLRLQITTRAWQQDVSGEMRLSGTEDLIVFPTLLTLKPGEERKIRVAHATTIGAVEKTYRVFVEELPAAAGEAQSTSVRILTRMGIPVFLQPAAIAARAALAGVGLEDGHLVFHLQNTGNAHFLPDEVRVRAFGPSGELLHDQTLPAWYVLAGGDRRFDVRFPEDGCGAIRRALIDVRVGTTSVSMPLATPGGACGS